MTETVFASGMLEAGQSYNLAAESDGYLVAVNFEEGTVVHSGNALAVINNLESKFNQQSANSLYIIAKSNTHTGAPTLQQAQNTIEVNRSKMELNLVNLKRYQKLWAGNSVAKVDLDDAELQYKTSKVDYESAMENYRKLQQEAEQEVINTRATKEINDLVSARSLVNAIGEGKVLKVFKKKGDYVKRGDAIALIGNPNTIYAKVNVDEANISKVKEGQAAYIQLNTRKNKIYEARVKEIYPAFDEASQSFICKLEFTDTLDFTIVDTQLQSNIVVGVTKDALLIPRNYIDYSGYVQVKGEKNKIKVETKFVSSQWVQVLKGISDNTILITEDLPKNKQTEGKPQ
ncbi:HlyD family efflux transporter periplasmic adaptor subunit [Pedobacter sp. SG908]|uniref:efflux RND transporter periplasmic adaptor subunit n=1 Tax=Pedobacter sp. SG908 TaxID=2587135 RepID=UPI0014235F9F|nr:multidrug resistance efflux pump [Pedobacter sp. SG908]